MALRRLALSALRDPLTVIVSLMLSVAAFYVAFTWPLPSLAFSAVFTGVAVHLIRLRKERKRGRGG